MNREMFQMLHRIKTAGEYQKKAILALLPEEMGRHLEVIEKEVRMMLAETAMELVKECCQANKSDAGPKTEHQEKKPAARKVEIE